jgi:hypothetical protein
MQTRIKELSDKRQELWKEFQNSWVKEIEKYTKTEPKEIDILGSEILTLLQQHHKELPVDFIIEELTKLGQAPSLVYDDNGHFAVTGDGYSSVSDDVQDAQIFCFVSKSQWKPTIREALEYYMFSRDEDEMTNEDYEEYLKSITEPSDMLPDNFFEPEKEE